MNAGSTQRPNGAPPPPVSVLPSPFLRLPSHGISVMPTVSGRLAGTAMRGEGGAERRTDAFLQLTDSAKANIALLASMLTLGFTSKTQPTHASMT